MIDQRSVFADEGAPDAAAVARARRVVAAGARDARECRMLLAMLGIVGSPAGAVPVDGVAVR